MPEKSFSLNFTSAAHEHIIGYLAKHPGGLRLGLETKGCSGYRLSADIVAECQAGDITLTIHDVTVFVAPDAVDKLDGATVDYIAQGINRQLVFRVPRATDYCGCGESFRFDEDKND